jgi:hypothetical protein
MGNNVSSCITDHDCVMTSAGFKTPRCCFSRHADLLNYETKVQYHSQSAADVDTALHARCYTHCDNKTTFESPFTYGKAQLTGLSTAVTHTAMNAQDKSLTGRIQALQTQIKGIQDARSKATAVATAHAAQSAVEKATPATKEHTLQTHVSHLENLVNGRYGPQQCEGGFPPLQQQQHFPPSQQQQQSFGFPGM